MSQPAAGKKLRQAKDVTRKDGRLPGQVIFARVLKLQVGLFLLFAVLPMRSGSLSTQEELESGDPLEAVYFEKGTLFGTQTQVPRPHVQVAQNLKAFIGQHPDRPELWKYLAQEEVFLLQFSEAEQHMLKYVQTRGESPEAYRELAAFYSSRRMPAKQIDALSSAARKQAASPTPGLAVESQPAYRRYMEILGIIDEQRPTGADPVTTLRDLIKLFPNEKSVARKLHEELRRKKRIQELREQLAAYRRSFPGDIEYALNLEADVLSLENHIQQAIRLLDSNFQPLWSVKSIGQYYDLIKKNPERWTAYTRELAERLERDPVDFDAAVRLFYCYQQDGNVERAVRVLYDFRRYKEEPEAPAAGKRPPPWTPTELYVVGHLFKQLFNFNEAARHFYALTELLSQPGYTPSKSPWPALQSRSTRETALYQVFDTLLQAVGRPTQLGAGNLGYYARISQVDRQPGFLNGILSLILNRTYPADRFREQESKATSYFNARKAEELYRVFAGRYPHSQHLPAMILGLARTYSRYGEHQAALRMGSGCMEKYPETEEALSAGILVADSYTALGKREDAWSTYDRLLSLLANRSQGELLPAAAPSTRRRSRVPARSPGAPSGSSGITYNYVLRRYISSLTTAGETMRVLSLYRREIDAHPNEAELYARLAQYLDQNRIYAEVERLYRQAIGQFKDRSWYDRLARWYLRRRMNAEYARISQQVAETFRGSEIDEYIRTIVQSGPAANRVFLQVNLFAHRRFPQNPSFIRNLLRYFHDPRTADSAEWEKLSRQHFFSSPDIQREYLAFLSGRNRLKPLLTTLSSRQVRNLPSGPDRLNPAELQFLAQGSIWLSEFEKAGPLVTDLVRAHPDIRSLVDIHSDLERSLGALDGKSTLESAQFQERMALIYPRDAGLLVKAGETYADARQMDKAVEIWGRLPSLKPGRRESYLQAASVFWDYFRFQEALKQILRYRDLSNNPRLLSYEAGAIYESRGELERGISEYLSVFDPRGPRDPRSRQRLRRLMDRETGRREILRQGIARMSGAGGIGFLTLYLDFLREENQTDEIVSAVETHLAELTRDPVLRKIRRVLRRLKLTALEERLVVAREKLAVKTIEKIQAAVDLAEFHVAGNRFELAAQDWNRLLATYPKNAGVIEGSVRYFWGHGPKRRALTILSSALLDSNRHYSRRFLTDLARYEIALGEFDSAEQSLLRLMKTDPLNVDYFNQLGRLYSQWGKTDRLSRHYRQGLQRLKATDQLAPPERLARMTRLRLGLIDAYTSLKRFVEAVDQYIEIIKQQPQDTPLVKKASAYAATHAVLGKFLDYFSRQAAQSSKDYRWPWVLARAHARMGNLSESLAFYGRTLDIQPDRIDILQGQIDILIRLHADDEAVASLRRLYRQTYRDSHWLYEAAGIRARQGRSREASNLLDEALDSDGHPPVERWLRRALYLESWNDPLEAFAAGSHALDLYERAPSESTLYQPGLGAYLEAGVRLGRFGEAWKRLVSPLSSVEGRNRYIVLSSLRELMPRALRRFASASELESAQETLRNAFQSAPALPRDQWRGLLLSISRSAGLPYLQEWLLKEMAADSYRRSSELYDGNWSRYRQSVDSLKQFYKERLAYTDLAEWQESDWHKNRYRTVYAGDLLEVVGYYRTLQKPTEEMRVLEGYLDLPLGQGSLSTSAVMRFVELLSQQNRESELETLVANPRHFVIALANALIRHGRPRLAAQAVLAASPSMGYLWTQTQRAMIGSTGGGDFDAVNQSFRRVLRLENIGNLLAGRPDPGKHFVGRNWYTYAWHYGEFLGHHAAEGDRGFEKFIVANLEGSPRESAVLLELGNTFLKLSKPSQAFEFMKEAVSSQPLSYRYRDRLAASLMALGRRSEAIEEWQKILRNQRSAGGRSARRLDARIRNTELVLTAALQYNFYVEIQSGLHELALEALRVQGHHGIGRLLETLLSRTKTEDRAPLLRQWIEAAPAPLALADYLLDLDVLTSEEKEPIYGAAFNYYAARQNRGAVGSSYPSDRSAWRFHLAYARYLLELGKTDRCREQLGQMNLSPTWSEGHFGWYLLSARLELETQNPAAALHLLDLMIEKGQSFATAGRAVSAAAHLLRQKGFSEEAALLEEAYYRNRLIRENPGVADFLGLASALYQQGRRGEARKALVQMLSAAARPPHNLEQLFLPYNDRGRTAPPLEVRAAKVAEQYQDDAWARGQRLLLEQSSPPGIEGVYENRLALARLEIKDGDLEAGLNQIRELASDQLLPRRERESASRIIALLVDSSDSTTLQAWFEDPNTTASVPDHEWVQFVGALPRRRSGGVGDEMAAHRTALRDIPHGRLAASRIFAARNRGADPTLVAGALSRLLWMDPDQQALRPPIFHWLSERGRSRLALAVIDRDGSSRFGIPPQGRQLASQARLFPEPNSGHPLAVYGLNDKAAYDLALAVSKTASEGQLEDQAEFFARWAVALGKDDADRRAALHYLRELQQARNAKNSELRRVYRVQANLGRPPGGSR